MSWSALLPISPRRAVQLESTTPVRTLLAESAADPASSVTWNTRPRSRVEADTILAPSALLWSRYVRPMGDRSSTLPHISVDHSPIGLQIYSPDDFVRVAPQSQISHVHVLEELDHGSKVHNRVASLASQTYCGSVPPQVHEM